MYSTFSGGCERTARSPTRLWRLLVGNTCETHYKQGYKSCCSYLFIKSTRYVDGSCKPPPLVASASWSLRAPPPPNPAWRPLVHHPRQTAKTFDEEKALRTQALGAAQTRLAELKQQVDTKEGDNVRLDDRIRAMKLAVATKAEECEATKGDIAAMEASRKVRAVLPSTTVCILNS